MDNLSYNSETGLFSADKTDSILEELMILLSAKRVSFKKDTAGLPEYPGDWFFKPGFGTNAYEIKTTVETDLNLLKEYFKVALDSIKNKIHSIDISVVKNRLFPNRADITISAIQSNGLNISYSFFLEVV